MRCEMSSVDGEKCQYKFLNQRDVGIHTRIAHKDIIPRPEVKQKEGVKRRKLSRKPKHCKRAVCFDCFMKLLLNPDNYKVSLPYLDEHLKILGNDLVYTRNLDGGKNPCCNRLKRKTTRNQPQVQHKKRTKTDLATIQITNDQVPVVNSQAEDQVAYHQCKEIQKLQKKLDEVIKERSEEKRNNTILMETLQRCNLSLAEKDENICKISRQNEELKKETEVLRKRVEDLTRHQVENAETINKFQFELDESTKRNNEYEEVVECLKGENANLLSDLANKERLLCEQKVDGEKLRNTVRSLEYKNKKLEVDVENLRKQIDEHFTIAVENSSTIERF